jgi:hypothetical protein
MTRKTLFKAAICAASLAVLHPPARAATAAPASILVVHGIPGRDVAPTLDPLLPVDVLVAGKYCLLQGLTFGTIAGPFDIPAGTYSVAISLANPLAPCTNAAVITGNATVAAGQFAAIVAAISTSGAPTAEIYPIDVTPVGAGKQRLVAVHAADAPAVTVKAVSIGKPSEKASFPLAPGQVKEDTVPEKDAFFIDAKAGTTILGPVTVHLSDQGVAVVIAVGVAKTGSATLLTKIIPSVF